MRCGFRRNAKATNPNASKNAELGSGTAENPPAAHDAIAGNDPVEVTVAT